MLEIIPAHDVALAEHAAVIRALGRRVIGDVIEIGRRLADCKTRLGHGGWLPWLENEFGWSIATAERFIQVHENVGAKIVNLTNIDLPVSGLYLLAAPSTPDEVREAVIERAEAGGHLTLDDVKRMIEEARDKDADEAKLREEALRAEYEKQIYEVRAEADRKIFEVNANFDGKLVLDPKEAAAAATKVVEPLNKKIEHLQKKIDALNERERKRKEAKPKTSSEPIDDRLLSAATSIGTALAGLASRLTINPDEMIAIETRCLRATGQQLSERIGDSVKHAKAIKAWLDDFIQQTEATLNGEKHG
jgi:hypothetical protein